MRARGIRVIIYDPDPVPADFYQWDHIHFNAAAHAKIAAVLAAQIEASLKPQASAQPAPAKP
jgi:lysophospholipase L1-like esterase